MDAPRKCRVEPRAVNWRDESRRKAYSETRTRSAARRDSDRLTRPLTTHVHPRNVTSPAVRIVQCCRTGPQSTKSRQSWQVTDGPAARPTQSIVAARLGTVAESVRSLRFNSRFGKCAPRIGNRCSLDVTGKDPSRQTIQRLVRRFSMRAAVSFPATLSTRTRFALLI